MCRLHQLKEALKVSIVFKLLKRIGRNLKLVLDPRNYIVLLRFKKIRFLVVKYRYLFFKKKLWIKNDGSAHVGQKTIEHNLSAFNTDAAFGCGDRMGLLIHPIIAFNSFANIDKSKKKVLIVGCRTEDDIFWMKSYGFRNTLGFDLFSYSKYILVGDIHKTDFRDGEFDVVLLGWMISYSKSPDIVIKECRRILKDGGLLGIGIEHDPYQDNSKIGQNVRVNSLNSTKEMIHLIDKTTKNKVIFEYDHCNDKNGDFSTAVVVMCL